MTLKDLADIIVLNGGAGFKSRKFDYSKLDPENVFKKRDRLDLSYTTISQFKECPVKFVMKKFFDIGFFKTSEALFLGTLVHKFVEDLINTYVSEKVKFDEFNICARSVYDGIHNKFERSLYPTVDSYVENIFKYSMGRKKFEPDIFFDDVSFITALASKKKNYVESKKKFFQNGAMLMKKVFALESAINIKKYCVEEWIKFPIEGLPVQFTGKIDLFFPFTKDEKNGIVIADFKTGKKEYFSWDQLNYYGLYFGKDKFETIQKMFFDLKEGERYTYNKKVGYQEVYDHLRGYCVEINNLHEQYLPLREELQKKYTTKLQSILKKSKPESVHTVPCEIIMGLFDIVDKYFFKAKNIENYHSNGGFACNFCDVNAYCTIRS